MAIQDFTAGQVLTAVQMDNLQANDYNQTVSTKTASYTLVAADKGTRVVMNSASATTITVNTSLFSAGDTLILQNISTGVCTVTAGTATVSSAGFLAIPQNGSGVLYFTSAGVSIFNPSAASASGLTLVRSQTIGSAVSSVAVTNAFNSTYTNYFVTINGGVGSTNQQLRLTFGSTATGYYYAANKVEYTGASGVFTGSNQSYVAECIYSAVNGISMNLFVQSPNLAARTGYQYNTAGMSTVGVILSVRGGGYVDNATQYTGFTLTCDAGTITGGDILIYGYANS